MKEGKRRRLKIRRQEKKQEQRKKKRQRERCWRDGDKKGSIWNWRDLPHQNTLGQVTHTHTRQDSDREGCRKKTKTTTRHCNELQSRFSNAHTHTHFMAMQEHCFHLLEIYYYYGLTWSWRCNLPGLDYSLSIKMYLSTQSTIDWLTHSFIHSEKNTDRPVCHLDGHRELFIWEGDGQGTGWGSLGPWNHHYHKAS